MGEKNIVEGQIKFSENNEVYNFLYDRKMDLFYLSIGSPLAAESIQIADGVWVRRSFKSDEIVGMTVENFSAVIGHLDTYLSRFEHQEDCLHFAEHVFHNKEVSHLVEA